MTTINATIFNIQDDKTFSRPADLWLHLAELLKEAYPQKYSFDPKRRNSFILLNEFSSSPCGSLKRYRRISIHIRRKANLPTLMEACVQNLYVEAGQSNFKSAELTKFPQLNNWKRNVQIVSLGDNLKFIQDFVADLNNLDWKVSFAKLTTTTHPTPKIKNRQGIIPFPVEKPSSLFREIFIPPRNLSFTVSTLFEKEQSLDNEILDLINRELQSTLGANNKHEVKHLTYAEKDSLNIVIIPDDLELNSSPQAKRVLYHYEKNGFLFKLTKLSSIRNKFSLKNVVCDLLHIGGGKFWEPQHHSQGFFAIDAGHSRELNKSRWTKVETDSDLNIIEIKTIDTHRAEHIPSAIQDELWPSQPTAIFCRDGRFAKERRFFLEKADKQNRSSMEVRKNPQSILWRVEGNTSTPSKFGDAVIDEHGEITLQSCNQNINDYISPLLININRGDRDTLINEFLNQLCLQSLSSFTVSRLHGALYYADLMSKLTEVGWPKIIGRGYKLVNTIPEA